MDRYLIKNGTLLSILDGSERKADVLVENGVITRIGANLECAGAEVYDAANMFVTVGWLEAHCHFLRPGGAGAVEINESLGAETADVFAGAGCKNVQILRDFYGKERIIRFQR